MPRCGSQCTLCDLPISFDTYKGCTHACSYCFVKRKKDISEVDFGESADSLLNFIKGKRDQKTKWCDWQIPIHWGGMSDPFQPAEAIHRRSLECLKVLEKTQYPFPLVLRGILITTEAMTSMTGGLSYAESNRIAELVKFAAMIVAAVPMLVMYPFVQKYFEQGFMTGAVKG